MSPEVGCSSKLVSPESLPSLRSVDQTHRIAETEKGAWEAASLHSDRNLSTSEAADRKRLRKPKGFCQPTGTLNLLLRTVRTFSRSTMAGLTAFSLDENAHHRSHSRKVWKEDGVMFRKETVRENTTSIAYPTKSLYHLGIRWRDHFGDGVAA